MHLWVTITLVVLASCGIHQEQTGLSEVEGYTINQKKETCTPSPLQCQTDSKQNDVFIKACTDQGHKIFRCSCELLLCSQTINP